MGVEVMDGLENLPERLRRCVLTVGNFDGVHVGHQAILRRARGLADSVGAAMVAMTFDRPPATLVAPEKVPEALLPGEVKHRLLGEGGADAVVVARATRPFLAMAAEAFVREVLAGRFAARYLIEGRNFFFGRGRGGNIGTLRAMAAECDFEVVEVPPVTLDLPPGGEVRVSSSLIRRLVHAGDVAGAGRCLGRPYTLYGRVVGGERRGRALEFPTANVAPAGTITPADGVYAARAEVAGETWAAAVSIGNKPTFGPTERCIEANLIGAAGDFYDLPIALAFLRRLRDQQRFPDAESLRARIAEDVERVRELCR